MKNEDLIFNLIGLITVVLFFLKITRLVDMSWFWVFSPILIPILICILLIIIVPIILWLVD